MNKIFLRTKRSKDRYVVARTAPFGEDSDQEDHRQGNIDTPEGTKVKWVARNDENVTGFTVNFFRLSDGTPTWPFIEKENGMGIAPIGYVGPLTLTRGTHVELTTKGSDAHPVKYEVTATPSGSAIIDKCDPMIIIRSKNLPNQSVLLGVTCAVLGAFVGALLVTWWT